MTFPRPHLPSALAFADATCSARSRRPLIERQRISSNNFAYERLDTVYAPRISVSIESPRLSAIPKPTYFVARSDAGSVCHRASIGKGSLFANSSAPRRDEHNSNRHIGL